jgi:hypothetical protein
VAARSEDETEFPEGARTTGRSQPMTACRLHERGRILGARCRQRDRVHDAKAAERGLALALDERSIEPRQPDLKLKWCWGNFRPSLGQRRQRTYSAARRCAFYRSPKRLAGKGPQRANSGPGTNRGNSASRSAPYQRKAHHRRMRRASALYLPLLGRRRLK